MGVHIAPAQAGDLETFFTTAGLAFGHDDDLDDHTRRFAELFEWDRSRCAFDGDQMVATAGTFSLDLTVPGATMPCAGTTFVGVIPSHRRRGILRALMDAHFDEVRLRGEPIAALWASDSAIYGRFGYGCASTEVEVEVARDHATFNRLAPEPEPARLITPAEAKSILPDLYNRIRYSRPGFFARSTEWWDVRRFSDRPKDRHGATSYRYAITEVGGAPTGYLQYRFKRAWEGGHGTGEVQVGELLGTSPGSWSGLWRFVLDHDLTRLITAPHRPLDDPLFELLAGRRRAVAEVGDNLWVRILDVPAALTGRRYAASVDTTLAVREPLDASVSTWRLEATPEGASCTPYLGEAAVALDVEDLGACFLGWSRFRSQAAAGRLSGPPSDLAALDAAFGWYPLPWCPEVF